MNNQKMNELMRRGRAPVSKEPVAEHQGTGGEKPASLGSADGGEHSPPSLKPTMNEWLKARGRRRRPR